MAKKKSWINFIKSLFISESKRKPAKKSKRWIWVFGKLKIKQQPTIAAPQRTLSEAREHQRKHALNVAIATAAAAEAAIAAAHAAAEVVRLTDASPSYHLCNKRIKNLAAIRIQCAYRGHLARKAFRALRGLVKLQAVVRGRIVRRQAASKLKCLPSITYIQSRAHERRIPTKHERYQNGGKQQILRPQEVGVRDLKVGEMGMKKIVRSNGSLINEPALECNGWRSWDDNILSVEDMEAIWSRKQVVIAKRECMMKHSSSHRERRDVQMVEEPLHNKENGRLGWRLKQWVDTEASTGPTVQSNDRKQDLIERIDHPFPPPRRSFCRVKTNSIGDGSSFPKSPSFPTYMSTTESAKAKTRSMSMPKQRLGFMDTCSDYNSPSKNRLPFWPSLNGEPISTCRKTGTSRQLST